MPTDKSVAEVEELKSVLAEANLIISTDYRGLNVTELSALRRAVREAGGTYRVSKNTLVKIASEEIDRPEISEIVVGPTGFVLSNDDPVAPTRALMKHIEDNRLEIVINGAYLEGKVVGVDRVKYLSTLPSREELVAKVLGQMNAPIANLVSVLSGTVRGLMTVLQAHIEKGGNSVAEAASDLPSEEPTAQVETTEDEAAEQEPEESGEAEEPTAQVETTEDEAAEQEPEESGEAEEDKSVN
ncbi:MAG: 50S ribosomal protein L10 [Dehalococcoidia bacterium]